MTQGTVQVRTSKFVSHQVVTSVIINHNRLKDGRVKKSPILVEKILRNLDKLNLELIHEVGKVGCKVIHKLDNETYLLKIGFHDAVEPRWWVEVEKLIEL